MSGFLTTRSAEAKKVISDGGENTMVTVILVLSRQIP
jgi:hypothetical protein